MRDPEERRRHFVIPDKKDENYDRPAIRRRAQVSEEDGEERAPREEKPRAARPRRTLREREMEEEEDLRSRRGSRRRRMIKQEEFDDDEEDFDDDDYRRPKAPKVVRIFAWAALVVILFTVGYVATNYFFAWSDKRGGERIGNVYGSGEEAARTPAEEETRPKAAGSRYSVYIPEGSSFRTRSIELQPGGTREEDIKKVLSMYIDSLKETKLMDPQAAVNNVFQGGEWLYVDMTQPFLDSVKKLKKEQAAGVLNGMLNTMRDNFTPVKKLKFYINSKEITDKKPVDLTGAWE